MAFGSSFRCQHCELVSDRDALLSLCGSPCILAVGLDPFPSVSGPVTVGGTVLHPSHKLAFGDLHALYLCQECGRTATSDGRQLVGACEAPSKKGRENLGRIRKGLYPSFAGPSRASTSLREARVQASAEQTARTPACASVQALDGTRACAAAARRADGASTAPSPPPLATPPHPPLGGADGSGGCCR